MTLAERSAQRLLTQMPEPLARHIDEFFGRLRSRG